jgi:hypothetical protein
MNANYDKITNLWIQKKSVMLIYFLKFLGLRRKRKIFSDILDAF